MMHRSTISCASSMPMCTADKTKDNPINDGNPRYRKCGNLGFYRRERANLAALKIPYWSQSVHLRD